MNLDLSLIVKGPEAKDLKKLLESDSSSGKNERSSTELNLSDDKLQIKIKATDTVAMRAAINTALKVANTYEKAKEAIK